MKYLAQQSLGGRIGGDGQGLGPFANFDYGSDGTPALTAITTAISSVIGFMTVAAAIWFMFQLIVGGYNWISSGGDKTKLESARDRITNAFIGLIIVVAGWSILALTGEFFGWDIVISDPGTLMESFFNLGGNQ